MSGKKASGKQYISTGSRNNVAKEITKAVSKDVTYLETALNRLDAYKKGKKTKLDTYSMPPHSKFKENKFKMGGGE